VATLVCWQSVSEATSLSWY